MIGGGFGFSFIFEFRLWPTCPHICLILTPPPSRRATHTGSASFLLYFIMLDCKLIVNCSCSGTLKG